MNKKNNQNNVKNTVKSNQNTVENNQNNKKKPEPWFHYQKKLQEKNILSEREW